MSAAYNGTLDTGPPREYWLKAEKDKQNRLARWKEMDRERLDALFDQFPGRDDVARDEEKIASILNNQTKRTEEEHQRLLDSRIIHGTPSDFLKTTGTKMRSKTRKSFDFES